MRVIISDAHEGLKAAAAKVFASTWQRCRVHFMRDALAHVPKDQHQMVAAIIRTAFVQQSQEEASTQWRETADRLRKRFPKLGSLMDETEAEVLAFMGFPREHWKQIASTNPLERVNKETGRRANVIGILPNDEAIIRLVGALVVEQTEEWHLTRRYVNKESLAKVMKPDQNERLLENQEVA